jgi:formylglycine-generating enzyme required for sulfatase activity
MRLFWLLAVSISIFFLGPTGCDQAPEAGDLWINPRDGMTFAWIPAGSAPFEIPYDSVDQTVYSWDTISFEQGFWLGQTEVTMGQFGKFVMETGYITTAEREENRFTWVNPGFEQTPDHPVVFVSIADARAYADWSGAALPLEEEWIYACRAASTTCFYWGDSLDERYLWYRENSVTGTQSVRNKLPNAWGLFDMVGNVWEYVYIKDCKVTYSKLGASWTRCNEARGWWGPVYGDVIRGAIDARLSECEKTVYAPYPFDDDAGFRLIKRLK